LAGAAAREQLRTPTAAQALTPASDHGRRGVGGRRGRELERFDLTERLVHWSLAVVVLVLLVTGAELYIPAFSLAVGHRALVENIHVYVGVCLPVPLLVGALGPWRRALLADLRRLSYWPRGEARWFRRPLAGAQEPRLGKFNPGQKLNTSLVGGALLLGLGTGLLMRWAPPAFVGFQTGATLVHDLVFLLLSLLVVGHIVMALLHPEAMRSIFHGRISEEWARRHAPRWLEEKGPGAPRRIAATRPRAGGRR
jgi:formate dehydrogenase subunit gamma